MLPAISNSPKLMSLALLPSTANTTFMDTKNGIIR